MENDQNRLANAGTLRTGRRDVLPPAMAGVAGISAWLAANIYWAHGPLDWVNGVLAFTAAAACAVAVRFAWKVLFSPDFESSHPEERLFAFLGASIVAIVLAIGFARLMPVSGMHF